MEFRRRRYEFLRGYELGLDEQTSPADVVLDVVVHMRYGSLATEAYQHAVGTPAYRFLNIDFPYPWPTSILVEYRDPCPFFWLVSASDELKLLGKGHTLDSELSFCCQGAIHEPLSVHDCHRPSASRELRAKARVVLPQPPLRVRCDSCVELSGPTPEDVDEPFSHRVLRRDFWLIKFGARIGRWTRSHGQERARDEMSKVRQILSKTDGGVGRLQLLRAPAYARPGGEFQALSNAAKGEEGKRLEKWKTPQQLKEF